MTTTNTVTPANTRRPVDIAAALTWLAHGGELARALKGDKAKHADVIWQLLVEAVEVIDKQPDQERRWLKSGTRSGWSMPGGLTRAELVALERTRFLSAMKPFDGQATYKPQGPDLDRALAILDWLRWCNAARNSERLRKSAVALARNGDTEIAAAIYAPTPRRDIAGSVARSGPVPLVTS
jgi:hypothetical protein